MLITLHDPANSKASQSELARRVGWLMRDGKPYHVLVGRVLKTLEKAKLITVVRGQIQLTKKGREVAEQGCSTRADGTGFCSTPEQD